MESKLRDIPISFGIVLFIICIVFVPGLHGNTNVKIRVVFGMCNTRHVAIGARSI